MCRSWDHKGVPRRPIAAFVEERGEPRSILLAENDKSLISTISIRLSRSLSLSFCLSRRALFSFRAARLAPTCEYSSAARMTARHSSGDSTAVRLRKMSAAPPGVDCSSPISFPLPFGGKSKTAQSRQRRAGRVGRGGDRGEYHCLDSWGNSRKKRYLAGGWGRRDSPSTLLEDWTVEDKNVRWRVAARREYPTASTTGKLTQAQNRR